MAARRMKRKPRNSTLQNSRNRSYTRTLGERREREGREREGEGVRKGRERERKGGRGGRERVRGKGKEGRDGREGRSEGGAASSLSTARFPIYL